MVGRKFFRFSSIRGDCVDKRLLKDLDKLTEFCYTGQIEVFHSLFKKY